MAKQRKRDTTSRGRRVRFAMDSTSAGQVLLAGDFNAWDPSSHCLKRNRKGTWAATLTLPPGTYQYRFVVDGEWVSDPNSTESVLNPFGTRNSVLHV